MKGRNTKGRNIYKKNTLQNPLPEANTTTASSKPFAQEIIDNLQLYVSTIDELNKLYKKGSHLIVKMEDFYDHWKHKIQQDTQHDKAGKMTRKELLDASDDFLYQRNNFEDEYMDLQTAINNLIEKLSDPNNKEEQENKQCGFYTLFEKIYHDTQSIYDGYNVLIDRLGRK